MAFDEDLSPFYNLEDFATDAVLDDVALNAAYGCAGIFHQRYIDALGVESTGPAYELPASSAPGVAHGSTLVLGSVTYKVVGVEPLGPDGRTLLLHLERQ